MLRGRTTTHILMRGGDANVAGKQEFDKTLEGGSFHGGRSHMNKSGDFWSGRPAR